MKTFEALEVIEVIDDETDAFGPRRGTVAISDNGGPRWAGPVAAAALIGLIGYGVATSAPTSSRPRAEPNTSTTVVAPSLATVPVPTIPQQQEVAYFAADPPAQFSVRYAERLLLVRDFGLVGYQLWATPDAAATTGSWFSITTSQGASPVYAADAYRVRSGELSIAVSHTADGHAIAQFTTADHVGVTIASFGWSDENLVRLAAAARPDTRGDVGFTDNWFSSDHRMISTVEPWLAVRGFPVEQIAYAPSQDLGNALLVTIAQPAALENPDDRQIALRFMLDDTTSFSVDGQPAVAGTIGDQSLATWTSGDQIITVTAPMPVSELVTIASTVHEVEAAKWEDMQFRADWNSANRSTGRVSPPVPVSFGTDAESQPWTIEVAMADYGSKTQINWSWAAQSGATRPLDNAQINTVVDDERTYVLADLPRAVAPTALLHVIRNGLDPVIVPFNDIDPNTDRTFAAYAFSETGGYTAQIVAPDGTILASYESAS